MSRSELGKQNKLEPDMYEIKEWAKKYSLPLRVIQLGYIKYYEITNSYRKVRSFSLRKLSTRKEKLSTWVG